MPSSKLDNEHHLTYIHAETSFRVETYYWFENYDYSMKITNKGLDTVYQKVQEIFRAIDMSSNRFVGEILESVGDLKVLNMLNLSNNILTGHIPLLSRPKPDRVWCMRKLQSKDL